MLPIIISGIPGSGKSTVAKYVAKKLKLKLISSGSIFRELSYKYGFNDKEKFIEFIKFAEKKGIDEEVDKRILKYCKKGYVIDSKFAFKLFKGKAIRIFLKVNEKEAIKRIALRDKVSKKVAKKLFKERFEESIRKAKKLYKIDITDYSNCDLILNTSFLTIKQECLLVYNFIKFTLSNL